MKFVNCMRFASLNSQTKSGITIFTAKIQDSFTKPEKLLHTYTLSVVETNGNHDDIVLRNHSKK